MATAVAAPGRGGAVVAPRPRGRGRSVVTIVLVVIAVIAIWEGLKFVAGTPWRVPGAGLESPIVWRPPFYWQHANDLNLPHVWSIAIALGEPFQSGTHESLAQYLFGAALYTWRSAAVGFVLGAALGLVLATIFVHSRLLERALVPYVVASQTVPIIALAPLIVFALGQGLLAVVLIATYLTFFPVTIAMLRGLRSFDPRALELLRSYGASRRDVYWKLRLPASMPYLFTALKIAATAAIVGAIIGEDT